MRIVIAAENGKNLGFLLDNSRLLEVFPADDAPGTFHVGDIILGRVRDVVPSLKACFVNITMSGDKHADMAAGFLPFYDCVGVNAVMKPETVLPVQITAMPSGSKPCRLSAKLNIAGKYCVVGNGISGVSISRKLDNIVSSSLKDIVSSSKEAGSLKAHGFGVIVRTNAGRFATASAEESEDTEILLGEISDLDSQLAGIIADSRTRVQGTVLYSSPGLLAQKIMNNEPEEVLIDESAVNNCFDLHNISIQGETRKVAGSMAVMGIKRQLDEGLARRVWLKSGAYLVIDHTESLTAVDVNSGKAVIKGRRNDDAVAAKMAYDVNKEAAYEVFRQMRLRNISGMILVDFINMDSEYTDRLSIILNSLADKDPVHAGFVDFTGLGLAEITRKKEGQRLEELVVDTAGTKL